MIRRVIAVLAVLPVFVGLGGTAAVAAPVPFQVSNYADALPYSTPCGVARSATCLDPVLWRHVRTPLADALAESSRPLATTRDWTRCYRPVESGWRVVACPNGTVFGW